MTLVRNAAVGLVLTAAVSACYTYHPVPATEARLGEPVRARLSASEAARMQDLLGRDNRTIDGKLMAQSDSGLLMAVPTARGGPDGLTHQRIFVPRESLLELESRKLDRLRTGLVIGALSALAAAVVITQFDVGDPNPGEPKGGVDANILGIRIPLLSIFGH